MRRRVVGLFLMAFGILASCGAPGVMICQNGKPVTETVGITHAGISYTHDETVSCMRDGADQIRSLGSKVIKMWFSDDPVGAYSVNCDWSRFDIQNSVDLLKTDYYSEVFGMDFKTYVLETHTFDKKYQDSNVNWLDGMNEEETARTENEMYEVSKYLLQTYNGSGKEFILQNWEGDNMLGGRFWRLDSKTGYYYEVDKGRKSANAEDDALMRARIQGLTDWFNARQRGVDKAVAEFGKFSDVSVRHAVELNFAYLPFDEGWPYSDSPMVLKDIVPYTDCDLYSLSCWGSLTIDKAHTLRDRLVLIAKGVGDTWTDIADGGKVKPRRPFSRPAQVSRLMLGEYGAIERLQGTETGEWVPVLSEITDLRHRKVLQIQTELALELGLEYVLYWELYCNVPRTDTDPPMTINNHAGERAASNDVLQGNWIIRQDGTVTEGYKYLSGLFRPELNLYSDEVLEYGKVYRISGGYEGFEVSGILVTDSELSNMAEGRKFGDEIKVSGSVNGKDFTEMEIDSFFTQCVEEDGRFVSLVKYVNLRPEDFGYRYFKVEKADGADRLTPCRIKFYKPKRNIVTKYADE